LQILRKTFSLEYEEALKNAALTLMSTGVEVTSRVLPKVDEAHPRLWEEEFVHKGMQPFDVSQRPYYFMYCIQRWLSPVLDLRDAGITVGCAVDSRT
jgi:hypothetical protein